MSFSFFKYFVSITYGVTVCNEHIELDRLLDCLVSNINSNDEIIVLQDVTKTDSLTTAVIEKYKRKVKHIQAPLNNDFSTFKNLLIEQAKCGYLFQIDADELPKPSLLHNLKKTIFKKRNRDCLLVSRINIVNGYTTQHQHKWKWNINSEGFINFPDYQPRIIKLNGRIRWKNKVHEVFTGYTKIYNIPDEKYSMCLLHVKDIKQQESQNNFYETLSE
jgi:glycosyltransferase involved in cell wall biosynthesis